ncbi:MAG: hypothetical protein KGJ13_03590 [Patescibacteria group bacterium]|nr:hypothetical protein [Patescibacteria group bacterium]
MKLPLNLLAATLLAFAASAQTNYFGVYSDSNYNILPGYTIPVAQVIGATNALTNYTTLSSFQSLTNGGIASLTNVTALGTILTNLGETVFPAWPTLSTGNNSLQWGGLSNTIGLSTPVMDNAEIVGGKSNTITSYSIAPGIFGGIQNTINGGNWAAIIGGQNNSLQGSGDLIAGSISSLIFSGTNSSILGGSNNIIALGSQSVIAGGGFNTVGQEYGYRGVYDGPYEADYSFAAGRGAWPIFGGSFIWADNEGTNGTIRNTTTNQFIIRAQNGVGINTNNPGANALLVNGPVDIEPGTLTLGGTNVMTLFSPTITSNALNAQWNANLQATTNGLAAMININSNGITTLSNVWLVGSNILWQYTESSSNSLWLNSKPSKAFTATLPATYSSIGIAFTTPLMPDANYSVSLLPQDSTTAGAAAAGMQWYVGSKSASGFSIYVPFATNTFNLNFDCIVHENTQ